MRYRILKDIEEVYEVAGEYDIVTLVSTSTLEEFRTSCKTNHENKRCKKHHNHYNIAAAQRAYCCLGKAP